MKEYKDIILDFTHPPKQAETYTYYLVGKFWEIFSYEEVFLGGDVTLNITVTPVTATRFELTFDYLGEVSVECDRCLASMPLAIDNQEYVNVTIGDALNDENDEEITLDAQDPVYDFSWIAFELLAINASMIHVHENIDECDPEVIKYLSTNEDQVTIVDDERRKELMELLTKDNKNNN